MHFLYPAILYLVRVFDQHDRNETKHFYKLKYKTNLNFWQFQ